jgi:hypothetical protein
MVQSDMGSRLAAAFSAYCPQIFPRLGTKHAQCCSHCQAFERIIGNTLTTNRQRRGILPFLEKNFLLLCIFLLYI